MSQSIFKISNELQLIVNEIIEAGGELTEQNEDALIIKEGELQSKSQDYGYVIKRLEYENKIIDDEVKRLNEIKKFRSNAIERLKNILSTTMQTFNIPEIETPTMKINFRKSSSVEIFDEEKIPNQFKTAKTTITISKTDIKKAISAGEEIEGARIVENQNLQIK